ncbi:MAG: MBL fold metallo-hydrolase [bacterium]|nr:MBL fold metallo-hydrolase [bacterium]
MNKYILATLLMIVISVIGINSAKGMHDNNLHVVVCDVGQGDGIFIQTPRNNSFLIDAGPDAKIEKCLNKRKPFFDRQLNGAFVSHFHADHIAGFMPIFKSFAVNTIIKNELNYPSPEKKEFEVQALAETKDIQEVWQGDSINIEPEVSMHVLWPKETSWNRSNGNWEAYLADFNDSSLVLLLKYKQSAVLLSGDVGTSILDSIANELQFKS